jgi:hypothetical protein
MALHPAWRFEATALNGPEEARWRVRSGAAHEWAGSRKMHHGGTRRCQARSIPNAGTQKVHPALTRRRRQSYA